MSAAAALGAEDEVGSQQSASLTTSALARLKKQNGNLPNVHTSIIIAIYALAKRTIDGSQASRTTAGRDGLNHPLSSMSQQIYPVVEVSTDQCYNSRVNVMLGTQKCKYWSCWPAILHPLIGFCREPKRNDAQTLN